MRLQVFDIIEETLALLEENHSLYVSVEDEIRTSLEALFENAEDDRVIDINSRIKSKDSLREKIIRNRMYIDRENASCILNSLSDLIGFAIECRFIEDEYKVLKFLRDKFTQCADDGYCYQEDQPNIRLDLGSHQPQIQKNGFSIYRIDGYVLREGERINFELQIKALVNSFWGDIEHKLVYKNTNFYVYDEFMKDILSSIKANLTIIDRQLAIVFDQMNNSKNSRAPLLNESSFEMLIAKAINDIFATKMNRSIGFTMNLKNISSILGHYIFYKNIQNGSVDQDQMTWLFKSFRRLNSVEIDFESEVTLDQNFSSNDPFIDIFGKYLIKTINKDYDWFVFLKMLFVIEPGNNMEDFNTFLQVIKSYMIDDYWLHTSFVMLDMEESKIVQDMCSSILAQSLVDIGSIKIIHNDKMSSINKNFVHYIEFLETEVKSLAMFEDNKEEYVRIWKERMDEIFNA